MAFLVLVLTVVLKTSGVAVFCNTYTDQATCITDKLCVWTKPATGCDDLPVASDCTPANTCNTNICDHTPGVPAKCEEETASCVSLTTKGGCIATAGCSWMSNPDECVGDTWEYSNSIQCKLWPTIVQTKKYGTCRAGPTGNIFTGNCVEKSAPQCVEKVAGSGKICQLSEDKTVCSGDDAEYCDYVAAICGPIFGCSNPDGACNTTHTQMGCVEGGSCSGTLTPPGAICTGITPAVQGDCTAVTNCKFIGAVAETCVPKFSVCAHKCVVKNNGGENNSVSTWDKEAAFTIKTPFSIITLLIFVLLM